MYEILVQLPDLGVFTLSKSQLVHTSALTAIQKVKLNACHTPKNLILTRLDASYKPSENTIPPLFIVHDLLLVYFSFAGTSQTH